jgi:hypothetical protein
VIHIVVAWLVGTWEEGGDGMALTELIFVGNSSKMEM